MAVVLSLVVVDDVVGVVCTFGFGGAGRIGGLPLALLAVCCRRRHCRWHTHTTLVVAAVIVVVAGAVGVMNVVVVVVVDVVVVCDGGVVMVVGFSLWVNSS